MRLRPKSSPLLSGYVGGRFVGWTLGAFAVVAFLIYLLELVDALRRASKKDDVGFSDVALLATYRVPSFLEITAPILILIAAVGAFWWMTRSQEFTVMRATGTSFWQFARPVFGITFFIGVGFVTIVNPLSVKLNAAFDAKMAELYKRVPPAISFNNTQAGIWLSDSPTARSTPGGMGGVEGARFILRADERIPGPPDEFIGIDLFELDAAGGLTRSLNAERALLSNTGLLTLFRASRLEQDGTRTDVAAPTFQTALTRQQLERSVDAQLAPTLWNILAVRAERAKRAGEAASETASETDGASDNWIGTLEQGRLTLWLHKLLALPILLMATVALAGAFALRLPRKGRTGLLIATALMISVAYHFTSDVLFALGLSGRLPPWLAIWAPVSLLGSFSIFALTVTEDA